MCLRSPTGTVRYRQVARCGHRTRGSWTPNALAIGTPTGPRPNPSRTRTAYLGAVIVMGGTVLVFSAIRLVSDPFPPAWYLLALMTLLTGWATIRMPGFPISLSLSDTFTMTAALLFGPPAGALLAGGDALVMSMTLARGSRTAPRILFNVAAPALRHVDRGVDLLSTGDPARADRPHRPCPRGVRNRLLRPQHRFDRRRRCRWPPAAGVGGLARTFPSALADLFRRLVVRRVAAGVVGARAWPPCRRWRSRSR